MNEIIALILKIIYRAARIYVVFCIGYWLFHRFFVILPSRKITTLPSDYGIRFQELFFNTTARTQLQGWFLFSNKSPIEINGKEALIVFLPGNAGALSKFLPGLKELVNYGFNVFALSYRGFGKSDFRWPTEQGVYHDAQAALNFLIHDKGYAPEQLVVYGQSMGCAIASYAAGIVKPKALILEAGFPSLPAVVSRFIPWLPINLINTSRFDTLQHLNNVHCPVLVAHSHEDRSVTMRQAEMIFNAAHKPKQKVVIHGTHAKGLEENPGSYLTAINQFIRETPSS
ncbi:MAG: alpha/beta fold hydrolase [bacterium]